MLFHCFECLASKIKIHNFYSNINKLSNNTQLNVKLNK